MKPVGGLDGPTLLGEQEATALRAKLTGVAAALLEARKLADLPRSRVDIARDEAWHQALYTRIVAMHAVVNLLGRDVHLRAQSGDFDGALTSCRAILHAAHTCASEPLPPEVRSSLGYHHQEFMPIARTLALGQPSDAALAALQATLEEEDAQPLLLNVLRGERAYAPFSVEELGLHNTYPPPFDLPYWVPRGLLDHVAGTDQNRVSPAFRAAWIRYLNDAVELVKHTPVQDQERQFARMAVKKDNEVRATPAAHPEALVNVLPYVARTERQAIRYRSFLRSALVMVAAERYRRMHRSWPGVAADLVPVFLKAVPQDPFAGGNVRLRRIADGLAVYCVGTDGRDNGGNLEQKWNEAGADLGFRLWDVPHRRQPPIAVAVPGAPGPVK